MRSTSCRGGAILAGNHVSVADSFFTPLHIAQVTYLAKNEYFTEKGVKGGQEGFFSGMGQVPVDRSGASASEAALRTGLRILGGGSLLGLYPEGTRSPDGRLYRGKTGVARMALTVGVPVVPVAMLNADEIQPPGTIIPKLLRPRIRFGPPMDFSRYAGMAGDRFVERTITDEIMYELMTLSGRAYVDVYAARQGGRLEPNCTNAPRVTGRGPGTVPTARHQGRLNLGSPAPGGPVARYFYDCEFIEDGRTIELISIGVGPPTAVSSTRCPRPDRLAPALGYASRAERLPASAWRSRSAIRDELYGFLTAPRLPMELWPGSPPTTTW